MEAQMNLDLAGRPSACAILDRIREDSRDQAEKGRWFARRGWAGGLSMSVDMLSVQYSWIMEESMSC